METVQSSTGGQGSLWRTDRRVSPWGVRMDGVREKGEEVYYKPVFVHDKGVADALQKMAEQGRDGGTNELVCRSSHHILTLCRQK